MLEEWHIKPGHLEICLYLLRQLNFVKDDPEGEEEESVRLRQTSPSVILEGDTPLDEKLAWDSGLPKSLLEMTEYLLLICPPSRLPSLLRRPELREERLFQESGLPQPRNPPLRRR